METSGIYNQSLSDPAILQRLGVFLKDVRLAQNRTQEDVSSAAGINRTTLVQMEKGSGGTMMTFIRVLRTLDQLHLLNAFVFQQEISPMKLAEMEMKKRYRARASKNNNNQNLSSW